MLKFAVADVKILDSVLIPQDANRAARRAIKTAHRHHFAYTPRPGYLYIRSRAISSRCNDNFDEFPGEEIEKGYKTFIGKPVFVNHHNDDHRTMRGVVIDAALHRDTLPSGAPDTWCEVLMEVDAVRFPRLAKRIIDKDIDRTSMGCFLPGTPITMSDGTRKPIEKIALDDEVLTHTGKTEPVTYVMVRDYEGVVYDLRSYGQAAPFVLTPEHPVWVRRDAASSYKARKTGEAQASLCVCGRQFASGPSLSAHLREADRHGWQGEHRPDRDENAGWVEAKDVRVGDWVLTPRLQDGHPGSRAFARLLGYYLAEGNLGWDRKRSADRPVSVEWDFNADEVEYVAEVCSLVEEMGYSVAGPYTKSNCTTVRVNSPEFAARFLEHGGMHSWAKRVTSEVLGWSQENLFALVTAYFNGDGHFRDGRVEAGTASRDLAQQIHLMSVRAGIPMTPPVRQHSPSAQQANSLPKYVMQAVLDPAKVAQSTQVQIDAAGAWRRVTEVRVLHYTGPVHNFDVEGDDSYVAADVAAHNCDVDYSVCSVCNNKATNPAEYCAHIPRMKGQRIYRADPKTGKKEGILVREICFTPETPILMHDAVEIPIAGIQIGDWVLDHLSQPRRVVKTTVREVDEQIVVIEQVGHAKPVRMTTEHPVLVLPRAVTAGGQRKWMEHRLSSGKIAPEFLPASEIQPGDFVAQVVPSGTGSLAKIVVADWSAQDLDHSRSHPEITVPDRYYTPERAWGGRQHILRACRACGQEMDLYPSETARMYCSSACWGDGYARGNSAHSGSLASHILPDTIEMTAEFGRWVGWFLAEGSITYQHGRRHPRGVIFALHVKEETHAQEILRLGAEIFGLNGLNQIKGAHGRTVEFYSAPLARLMSSLGDGFYTKALPDEWMSAPIEFLEGVVTAHHDGDGEHGGGRTGGRVDPEVMQHATSSPRLADQLYVLHLMLGHTPTRKRPDMPGGKSKRTVPGYSVRARLDGDAQTRMSWGPWVFAPVRSVQREHYVGSVHNIEVEGTHTYVANHMAVHNCYGLRFFENSLLVEEPADPTAYFLGVDDSGLKMSASKTATREQKRQVDHIEEAIAGYAAHAGNGEGGGPGSLYSSEGLAEIYAPRVKQLIDLQNKGHNYAEWKWDPETGTNHWHGLSDDEANSIPAEHLASKTASEDPSATTDGSSVYCKDCSGWGSSDSDHEPISARELWSQHPHGAACNRCGKEISPPRPHTEAECEDGSACEGGPHVSADDPRRQWRGAEEQTYSNTSAPQKMVEHILGEHDRQVDESDAQRSVEDAFRGTEAGDAEWLLRQQNQGPSKWSMKAMASMFRNAINTDENGWFTKPREGFSKAETECPHRFWTKDGTCTGCGYNAGDEGDAHEMVDDAMRERLGDHNMESANYLLDQNHTGPTKWSTKTATWSQARHPQPIIHAAGSRPARPLMTGDTVLWPSGHSSPIVGHAESVLMFPEGMRHRAPIEGDSSNVITAQTPEDMAQIDDAVGATPEQKDFLRSNPTGPSGCSSLRAMAANFVPFDPSKHRPANYDALDERMRNGVDTTLEAMHQARVMGHQPMGIAMHNREIAIHCQHCPNTTSVSYQPGTSKNPGEWQVRGALHASPCAENPQGNAYQDNSGPYRSKSFPGGEDWAAAEHRYFGPEDEVMHSLSSMASMFHVGHGDHGTPDVGPLHDGDDYETLHHHKDGKTFLPMLGCPHCNGSFYKPEAREQHIRENHPGQYAGPSADMQVMNDMFEQRKQESEAAERGDLGATPYIKKGDFEALHHHLTNHPGHEVYDGSDLEEHDPEDVWDKRHMEGFHDAVHRQMEEENPRGRYGEGEFGYHFHLPSHIPEEHGEYRHFVNLPNYKEADPKHDLGPAMETHLIKAHGWDPEDAKRQWDLPRWHERQHDSNDPEEGDEPFNHHHGSLSAMAAWFEAPKEGDDWDFFQQARDREQAKKREVNLADPVDLKVHLREVHDMSPGDFQRSHYAEDHPALDPVSSIGRPLFPHELRALHDYQHSAGDLPGVAVGDSHFHSASRKQAGDFTIPLGDDDRNFYQQMRDAGEMRRQMHEHAEKREVNLADPVDLKSHLIETHGMEPGDFWRNSHDEDHEALDIAHGDDRPLRSHELRDLHAHDHKHDPGDYPGVIIGDSHFHSASKTAQRVQDMDLVRGRTPMCENHAQSLLSKAQTFGADSIKPVGEPYDGVCDTCERSGLDEMRGEMWTREEAGKHGHDLGEFEPHPKLPELKVSYCKDCGQPGFYGGMSGPMPRGTAVEKDCEPWDPKQARKTAELSDDEIQKGLSLPEAGKPVNKGEEIGQHLWSGFVKAMGFEDEDEMRLHNHNKQMVDLKDRYGEHPGGKYDWDDRDEEGDKNGEPYYEVKHPSGFTARDYGGANVHIYHQATPDEAHDLIDAHDESAPKNEHGYRDSMGSFGKPGWKHPQYGHDALTQELHNWVGESGDDYARNNSRIQRWQRTRRGSRTASGGSNDRMVKCDQGHDHWGAEGAAGLLLRHQGHDGQTRYLLQKRGPKVDHPNTHSIPGGALGQGETPVHGAIREGQEEMGQLPNFRVRDTHVSDCGGWKYHTLIADVDHQFDPPGGEDSREQASTGWHTADEIDGLRLHPGFESSWADIQERGH